MNPYIDLKRIEFAITNTCSSRCKHCSLGDKLKGRSQSIDKSHALNVVEEVASLYQIESLMTFGGEPLLFADTTLAIHDMAKKCCIPKRQVISNGYFSKDHHAIDDLAKRIASSGITDILISVDCFHEEHIPLELQHMFLSRLNSYGYDTLKLHPVWIKSLEDDNRYNKKTKECLEHFKDLELEVSSGNVVFPSGYALENLKEFFDQPQLDLNVECGSYDYTESPEEINTLYIGPGGNVEVCSQVIGNIYEEDILNILMKYNPHDYPGLSCVIKEGIKGLVERHEAQGHKIDYSKHYSTCSLCKHIRGIS